MTIATLFKPKVVADARPAAAALQALRTRTAALVGEDEQWIAKENAALRDIREHDASVAELEHFKQRHVDALAERELRPGSTPTPEGMRLRVDEAEARAQRLGERRQVSERVLAKVREERARIRTAQVECRDQLAAHQHGAVVEHLHAIAPAFLEAERQYLDALARVYSASRLCDRIAREQLQAGRPHLGWSGDLSVTNIFTPRPDGQAFLPVPQRGDVEAAIRAEAAALEKQFLT